MSGAVIRPGGSVASGKAESSDAAKVDAKPSEGEKAEAAEITDANADVVAEAATPPLPQATPLVTPPLVTPHVIQIAETVAPPVNAENTQTAPAAAPVEAAPAPQAAAPPEPITPTAGVDSIEHAATSDTKHLAPDAKPQADAPQAPATSAAPPTQQAPAPQPTAAPPTLAAGAPPPAAVTAVQPSAAERPAPTQRNGKSEPRDSKQVASAGEAKPEAPSANVAQAQKGASPNKSGNDALPATLAIQADAPEIPAPLQQTGATPFAQPSAHAQSVAAIDHTNAVRAAPAASQVAHEVIRRFTGENTRFELRLDPPELGRVEVRLEVSRDHRVTALISADSPQALTELSRHARDLEQMLNDAGLQLSDSGLSFDLRQGSEGADADKTRSSALTAEGDDDATQQIPTAARPLGFERWRGVRVDVTV